ncbi:MAG TPA: hypothetical protein VN653_00030 [Anaerolineales bacterium]|jgi:hypothetical protein|nr:hypothetical protein [Anaerolineales bacterium]
MDFIQEFETRLPKNLRNTFNGLNSPFVIQQYLDSLTYNGEERDRSPLNVMLDNQSHCLDGGFLAALCLWRLGFKPLLIDIVPDPGVDDDHVLALYQIEGRWGALAKSNYINLGFREPVYKNLRELVMTYFEHYVSIQQLKCLTGYTRPIDASHYTHLDWAWNEAGANTLYHKHFYGRKPIPLISKSMAGRLSLVTDRAYASETMYTNLNESFGNRKY